MMITRIPLGVSLTILIAAACSRDNDLVAGVPQWSVDSIPVVDITGTAPNGQPAFMSAAGATRLSNGDIVVADETDATVRFFDASGRSIRNVGRAGDGPGEFSTVRWVGQCGVDSVFAWDHLQASISVIDTAGRITREYREQPNINDFTCTRSGIVAGSFLPVGGGPASATVPLVSAPLWISDTGSSDKRIVDTIPYGELRPLGIRARIAISDRYLYAGTSESAVIRVYSLDGSLVRTISTGVPRRHPTARENRVAVEKMASQFPGSGSRDAARERLLQIPMPEYLPAYSALFTDPAGKLWVQLSAPGDSVTWLRVIDANGAILGDVHIPVDFTVFEVGPNYLLGEYDEESGEQHVVLYQIDRG